MFQELLGPLSRPLFSSVGSELVEVAPADRAGPTFSEPNFLLFLPCSSTLRQRKGPLLVQTYFHGGGVKSNTFRTISYYSATSKDWIINHSLKTFSVLSPISKVKPRSLGHVLWWFRDQSCRLGEDRFVLRANQLISAVTFIAAEVKAC